MQGNINDYFIRKHMRNIVKFYLTEVDRARPIKITDSTRFGRHMESLGLSLGYQQNTSNRTLQPDGNVLVLSLLSAFLVFLFLRK